MIGWNLDVIAIAKAEVQAAGAGEDELVCVSLLRMTGMQGPVTDDPIVGHIQGQAQGRSRLHVTDPAVQVLTSSVAMGFDMDR